MNRKKLKDCEIFTMQRADNSWACTIESPHKTHTSVLSIGKLTEKEAIADCKVIWKRNYGTTNRKKITET